MESKKTVHVVYVGWVTLDDKTPGAVLHLVNEDKTLGRELFFARKAMSTASIGGVYEVEQASETSFVLAGRRYVGQFHDQAQVAAWQIDNKAQRIREEAIKAEKKIKETPEALALLKPLRDLYRTSLPDRKRAIEVVLLDYLRR